MHLSSDTSIVLSLFKRFHLDRIQLELPLIQKFRISSLNGHRIAVCDHIFYKEKKTFIRNQTSHRIERDLGGKKSTFFLTRIAFNWSSVIFISMHLLLTPTLI